jgi:RAV-like factor
LKSRYRGVVPQNNRKWGAQIYLRQNRVWVGTFDFEDEVAMAYDRANLKIITIQQQGPMNILGHGYSKEIRFQDMYSKQEILDMIKDHSYKDNLRRFMASGE